MPEKMKPKEPFKVVWRQRTLPDPYPEIGTSVHDAENDVYDLARAGQTCALITRGVKELDYYSLNKYTLFVKSFIHNRIQEGTSTFIVVLREAYDIIAGEILLHLRPSSPDLKLICVEIHSAYFHTLPPQLCKRYWRLLEQADETHCYSSKDAITQAEQYALLWADKLVYIYGEEAESEWVDFTTGIFEDQMKKDGHFYSLTKMWVITFDWIKARHFR